MTDFHTVSTDALKISLKMIIKRSPDYPIAKTDEIVRELKRRLPYKEFLNLLERL